MSLGRKFKPGLFLKVIVAITLGALLGMVASEPLVRVFKTFNVLFAQVLKFIIPLMVLGLVTPAIHLLGLFRPHLRFECLPLLPECRRTVSFRRVGKGFPTLF